MTGHDHNWIYDRNPQRRTGAMTMEAPPLSPIICTRCRHETWGILGPVDAADPWERRTIPQEPSECTVAGSP